MNTPASRPHVVIIGCGFGGLEATKALRHAHVDITLIDRSNHHLFQPLLYQVATAGLSAPAIAEPIRRLFRHQRNVTVLMGEVTGFDVAARQVLMVTPDGPPQRIGYDHLIVAAGATHSYFGHDEWAAHAPGLKTLADAFVLRRRLLTAYERAECLPPDAPAAQRDALLTSVVIGAGPTGVEMAGTMVEIARHTLAGEFRRIQPGRSRVILVEGGPRVLAAYPEQSSASALAQLRRLGVEVMLSAKVTGIDARGVDIEVAAAAAGDPAAPGGGGAVVRQRIDAATVIWAAGVAASPLARELAEATGAELDRAGRIRVQPDLSLSGHPQISVVGDMAAAMSYPQGTLQGSTAPRPVPGVSPGAKQAGRAAARNILLRLAGRPTRPFRYINYGDLATIGRSAAVADVEFPLLGKTRFSGYFAWLFWLLVHVYFLIGFRNRLVVLIDWAWAYWTFNRSARIVTPPESG